MRKSFLALALIAAALFVACKPKGGSNVVGPVPTDSLETAFVSVKLDTLLRYPYALEVGLEAEYVTDSRLSAETRDRINSAMMGASLGDDFEAVPIDKVAPTIVDTLIASFGSEIWDYDDGDLSYWMNENGDPVYSSWHVTGEVGYEAPKGYISYTIQGDEYHFGAAHGYYYIGVMIFDLSTGLQVHEGDLFVEGYQERLSELLNQYVETAENYEEGFLMVDTIEPNDNFSVHAGGITYFFNPYEITAYCYGIIDITIPWDALKDILRPDLNLSF